MTNIFRSEFGFKGYFVSDEGAIERVYLAHKYVNSSLQAAAAAINAGCNLELPRGGIKKPYYLLLDKAVQQGLVSFKTLVERVKPLFYTRMRLGLFDPPEMNPYTSIPTSELQSVKHRELATEAAAKTFVLLKNLKNTLPFRKSINKLAVSMK